MIALFGMTSAWLVVTVAALAADAAPSPAPAAEPDRMQQVVCRKDREIGSLVRSRKTCHTRAQWQYIDDTNQSFGRNLVDDTRSKPQGGN
jgi:hypothetical protein